MIKPVVLGEVIDNERDWYRSDLTCKNCAGDAHELFILEEVNNTIMISQDIPPK